MNTLRIHCFQHVPFEDLGCIKTWITKHGHELSYTRFFHEEAMPDINEIDWLIIMGGPMGFDDDHIYPWLPGEKEFIKTAVRKNKAVIGICLGAQLIAGVCGADCHHGDSSEIGWFPVFFQKENLEIAELDLFPETMTPLHWHSDTFDIPEGALLLASTEAYPNQAFILKDRVLGFQFHIELDKKAMNIISGHIAIDKKDTGQIQTKEEIMSVKKHFPVNNSVMFKILDKIEKTLNI